jgi:hypothetical protein
LQRVGYATVGIQIRGIPPFAKSAKDGAPGDLLHILPRTRSVPISYPAGRQRRWTTKKETRALRHRDHNFSNLRVRFEISVRIHRLGKGKDLCDLGMKMPIGQPVIDILLGDSQLFRDAGEFQ